MMRITKTTVQNLLNSFGEKPAIDIEHDALMSMLGVSMDDQKSKEDSGEEYGKDAMQKMHGMKNDSEHKGGSKMMALKIMVGGES